MHDSHQCCMCRRRKVKEIAFWRSRFRSTGSLKQLRTNFDEILSRDERGPKKMWLDFGGDPDFSVMRNSLC